MTNIRIIMFIENNEIENSVTTGRRTALLTRGCYQMIQTFLELNKIEKEKLGKFRKDSSHDIDIFWSILIAFSVQSEKKFVNFLCASLCTFLYAFIRQFLRLVKSSEDTYNFNNDEEFDVI